MFENIIAERMGRLHAESAFQILAQANALEARGHSVIHCEIGQPDFATPDHIIEAAYEAMKAGYTGYSPAPGYPDVRAAIADEAGARKGLDLSPDNIIIVPGGKPIMSKGRAEGNTERILTDLKNVMDSINVSVEEAMEILKIDPLQRQKYAARVK